MDLFRVAVVQAGSVPFDRERSTMKALDLTGQAIRSGARLIVFPEAFISGYPKGIDFGARVGMRSPEGRKWFRTYFESAIPSRRLSCGLPGDPGSRSADCADSRRQRNCQPARLRLGGAGLFR